MSRVAVIGAGFSGAVIARELAAHGYHIDVYEARDHVAGNCFTRRNALTGVMVHVYGPHIFHTDNERVWKYINFFGDMVPYNHKVKAEAGGTVYSMPINLHTLNQFFGTTLAPDQARTWIADSAEPIKEPANFEEQALSLMGRELYETFFKGYTIKQWGRDPRTLPAAVLKRLPFRFDYNDSYFSHPHQAIPREGYTAIVGAMLDHPGIKIHLSAAVTADEVERFGYEHVFYSGPLDAWFNYAFGRLAYRTLDFTPEIWEGDALGCPVMNYCDAGVPFTRRTEFKHFTPWETHAKSLVYRETSREAEPGDNLYYPVRLANDKVALTQYEMRAAAERRITFIGRLGTYRYLDMDATIAEALTITDKFLARKP
jgi:UDP-galactopyranose mutase